MHINDTLLLYKVICGQDKDYYGYYVYMAQLITLLLFFFVNFAWKSKQFSTEA